MSDEKKTCSSNSEKTRRIFGIFPTDTWVAIASSIAAVVSMILLFYQLYTDNPNLQIKLAGAAYIDFEEYEELYLPVWITAFNKGKRPIGILEAKLVIKFPKRIVEIACKLAKTAKRKDKITFAREKRLLKLKKHQFFLDITLKTQPTHLS